MEDKERGGKESLLQALNASATFWMVLAITSSSIEPILVKIGYRGAATPFQFLMIKALIGGIAILPLTGQWRWMNLAGIKKFLYVTLLFTVTNALILFSLKYVQALIVITIITTTPALVGLINQRMGRERLEKKFWAGFILSMLGIMLAIKIYQVGQVPIHLVGLLCALISVITSALYRTALEPMTREFSPKVCSTYIFIMNAVIVFVIGIPWITSIPAPVWPLGIIIGCAAAIANVAFLSAIHLLGSTRSSILGVLQRPVVLLAVALILKETLNEVQIVGIILTLAGTQMATVRRKKEPARPGI